ncbi:MAG: TlpA family protein disulfide reductase [Marinifilaceae bacterium]
MRLRKIIIMCLAAIMPLTLFAEGVKFRDINYGEALQVAKKEKKLVFIDFYTIWCGPCKMMAKDVFPTKIAGDYFNEGFISLKFDAEKGEGKELAKKFSVTGYPTFIIINSEEQELFRIRGYHKADDFIDRIRKGLDASWSPEQVEVRFKKGERTSELVNEYIYQLMISGREQEGYDVANAFFNKLSKKKRMKPENFFLYNRYCQGFEDMKAQYMYSNFSAFMKSDSKQTAFDLMYAWIRMKILPYASLRSAAILTEANLNEAKELAQCIGMDTVKSMANLLTIGEARLSGDMKSYVSACKELLPEMPEKDRFMLLQNLDVLLDQSQEIRDAAAALIRTYLDEFSSVSQRIVRAKMWKLEGKQEYNLNIIIDGATSGKVLLRGATPRSHAMDTFEFRDGKLSIYMGVRDTTTMSLRFVSDNLKIPTKKLGDNYPTASLLLVPGESALIKATVEKAKNPQLEWVRGNGQVTKDYITFNYTMPLPAQRAYDQLIVDNVIAGGDIRVYKEEYAAYIAARLENVRNFVKQYPQSYITATLLLEYYDLFDENKLQEMVNQFPDNIKGTWFGKAVISKLDRGRDFRVGTQAAAFTKKDLKGRNVSLSDWKGKYVLLDFWGSWCGPCRNSHPHLKALHKKYGNKVVFVNVARENSRKLDDAKKTWKQAIKEDGLTWTQILNNEDSENFDLLRLYNITAFPTKILVGPDGKIISRMVGASGDPEPLFKEIFKM